MEFQPLREKALSTEPTLPTPRRSRLWSVLLGLGTLTALLGLWQWGAGYYTSVILPPPGAVAMALQALVQQARLWIAIAATTFHVVTGFTLALVLGGLLGLTAGRHPWVQPAVTPISVALLGTPPIAWLVLTMVWFGLGHTNAISTVAVTVGPMVFAGVADAVMTLDPYLLAVAQVYQLQGKARFQALYWPHMISRLLPVLVTGLGIAWRVSIMSEVLATPTGIGAELNTARANLDTAEVMAWVVITITLVLASDTLLRQLQRWLLPWQRVRPMDIWG